MTLSSKHLLLCALLAIPSSAFIGSFFDFSTAPMALFSGAFFILLYLISNPPQKRELSLFPLSLFFSITRILGYSFDHYDSYTLIMKDMGTMMRSLLCILSLSLISFSVILFLFRLLSRQDRGLHSAPSLSRRSCVLLLFLILFAGSLPYLYLYFPGLNIFDTHDQLLQFFGYSSYIGDGLHLSDHHPVLLTVLYGLFIRLGLFFGSADLGQFLYSIVSLTAVSLSMSLLLSEFVSMGLSFRFCLILTVFWAVWPVPALYAFNMCKDVTIVPFLLLYALQMVRLWHQGEVWLQNRRHQLILFLLLVLMMMMRKSAMYAAVLALLFLLPRYRKNIRHLLLPYGSALVGFLLYSTLLLPLLHVIPGETREMLSVPFQMTARYMNTYPSDVTPEEKAAISAVLDPESFPEYDPRLSDAVKDRSRPDFTAGDLLQYMKAFASMGLRHPGVYLEAFLNLTYGYFYPSGSNTIVCLTLSSPDQGKIAFHQDPALEGLRLSLFNFIYYTLRRTPGISCLFYVDFVTWAFLFLLLSLRLLNGKGAGKHFGYFLAFGLIALLSPKSGEIRYILPMFYVLPALLCSVRLSAQKEGGAF